MKKTKWIYIVAAVLVALLLLVLLTGDEATAAKVPAMLVSIAAGMALVLGIIAAAYFLSGRKRKQEADFRAAAVAVQGRVIKIDRARMVKAQSSVYSVGGDMHILRAEYEYEGKRYTGARRSYFGEPPYKVGDAVKVYVNPDNPAECKILEDESPAQDGL